MKNCESFKFNDPEDLEKKVNMLETNNDGVYAVIIEPFSASMLEPCSDSFLEKLFFLKKKFFQERIEKFYKLIKIGT